MASRSARASSSGTAACHTIDNSDNRIAADALPWRSYRPACRSGPADRLARLAGVRDERIFHRVEHVVGAFAGRENLLNPGAMKPDIERAAALASLRRRSGVQVVAEMDRAIAGFGLQRNDRQIFVR